MISRVHLLFWCSAVGILAFVCFDLWSRHNAPLYQRLESQWREDVEEMENSHKLPRSWYDVSELLIIGGTPETKDWLKRIEVPIKTVKEGHYRMEVLVVAWEEDGKRGALIQYNVEDKKTKNNIFEIGRTLILSRPKPADPVKAFMEEFHF